MTPENQAALINWYRQNKRSLPWRGSTDPYVIWLSEIIMQQTRIAQGMAYYQRFITDYPTVAGLAAASEDEVLKRWQGLGYYSRARNMHYTARHIVHELGGHFPNTYAGLRKLKGVGEYTAAAIASLAFGEAVPAIDGNVFRFLSRLWGVATPINTGRGKKEFTQLARQVMPRTRPGEFNQALIEFGALQCIPKNPDCAACLFREECVAYRENRIAGLPVKARGQKLRDRYFCYVRLTQGNTIFLRRRPAGDIWQGLYEFPLLETPHPIPPEKLTQNPAWQGLLGTASVTLEYITPEIKHILSHQRLHARLVYAVLPPHGALPPAIAENYNPVPQEGFAQYAIPRLIERLLQMNSDV